MEKHRKSGTFPAEVRERAVRLVRESEGNHASRWAALVSVSRKIGCTAETLRRWVREAENDAGVRPGVTTDMAARVNEPMSGTAVAKKGWCQGRARPWRARSEIATKCSRFAKG